MHICWGVGPSERSQSSARTCSTSQASSDHPTLKADMRCTFTSDRIMQGRWRTCMGRSEGLTWTICTDATQADLIIGFSQLPPFHNDVHGVPPLEGMCILDATRTFPHYQVLTSAPKRYLHSRDAMFSICSITSQQPLVEMERDRGDGAA